MPLGTEVGLSLRDIVLDGDPFPKGAQPPPNFRPMSVVAKRLDGLRCHLVWRYALAQATMYSMGTQLPPEKRHTHHHPIFGACLLWPNSRMDEDATWYGSRPRPRPYCIRRGHSCPRKGHSSLPLFSAHVYCGHGRLSQLLLSSCLPLESIQSHSPCLYTAYKKPAPNFLGCRATVDGTARYTNLISVTHSLSQAVAN